MPYIDRFARGKPDFLCTITAGNPWQAKDLRMPCLCGEREACAIAGVGVVGEEWEGGVYRYALGVMGLPAG